MSPIAGCLYFLVNPRLTWLRASVDLASRSFSRIGAEHPSRNQPLFTAQHNFEHSYASPHERWSRDEAALSGTSFLILIFPGWLNWITADIAYHHVHHLCASVPNYRLAACHKEFEHLFSGARPTA